MAWVVERQSRTDREVHIVNYRPRCLRYFLHVLVPRGSRLPKLLLQDFLHRIFTWNKDVRVLSRQHF